MSERLRARWENVHDGCCKHGPRARLHKCRILNDDRYRRTDSSMVRATQVGYKIWRHTRDGRSCATAVAETGREHAFTTVKILAIDGVYEL